MFRRENSQSAGDGANQYSADKMQIIQNYGNTDEVKELARQEAREVVKNSLPEIAAAASATLMERGNWFVDLVLDIIEKHHDPRLFARMSDPRIQIALMSAQRDYSESNDTHLGHLLATIVTDMMSETTRTHDELLLKQCLEIAPKLSQQELATLAVLTHLNTVYSAVTDPTTLLHAIDSTFSPYYGGIVSDYRELSYMESIGVFTQSHFPPSTLGGECNAYTIAAGVNTQAALPPFELTDLPPGIQASELPKFVRPSFEGISIATASERISKYVVHPELRDEMNTASEMRIFGCAKNAVIRPEIEILEQFASSRMLVESDFDRAARERYPRLAEFFDELMNVGVLRFAPTATGRKLAEQEIIARNGDGPTVPSEYFLIGAPDDDSANPILEAG